MLYEIPDNAKNNLMLLLNKLSNNGISLEEVGAIHELIVILNSPISKKEGE